MRRLLSPINAIAAICLGIGVTFGSGESADHNASGKGVSTCNCTGTAETGMTISHAATVAVSLDDGGANIGNHSTGLSGAAQSGATIAAHTCKYVHYIFLCDQVADTWFCVLQSWHIDTRVTEPADCE